MMQKAKQQAKVLDKFHNTTPPRVLQKLAVALTTLQGLNMKIHEELHNASIAKHILAEKVTLGASSRLLLDACFGSSLVRASAHALRIALGWERCSEVCFGTLLLFPNELVLSLSIRRLNMCHVGGQASA